MTDKIPIEKVLAKDAVQSVREETASERFFRRIGDSSILIVACLVILVGFGFLVFVFLSDTVSLGKYKDAAWSGITTLIGAAIGFAFGKRA